MNRVKVNIKSPQDVIPLVTEIVSVRLSSVKGIRAKFIACPEISGRIDEKSDEWRSMTRAVCLFLTMDLRELYKLRDTNRLYVENQFMNLFFILHLFSSFSFLQQNFQLSHTRFANNCWFPLVAGETRRWNPIRTWYEDVCKRQHCEYTKYIQQDFIADVDNIPTGFNDHELRSTTIFYVFGESFILQIVKNTSTAFLNLGVPFNSLILTDTRFSMASKMVRVLFRVLNIQELRLTSLAYHFYLLFNTNLRSYNKISERNNNSGFSSKLIADSLKK
ncbi:hypothetical protein GQR58_018155 [Nymphon striatum]|nr:hypothetical protein GQR58_018155 [Nymphon striatum]